MLSCVEIHDYKILKLCNLAKVNLTMAFIKIEDIVINTNYIVAVQLESQSCSGERCVSILLATPKFTRLQLGATYSSPYHYEWIDFTGKQAIVLQDYFSSFNNVIELLPQHQEQPTL